MKEGFGQFGPFFDEKLLRAWLQEMALRLLPGAALFGSLFPDPDKALADLQKQYTDQVHVWLKKPAAAPSAKEVP